MNRENIMKRCNIFLEYQTNLVMLLSHIHFLPGFKLTIINGYTCQVNLRYYRVLGSVVF